jgi:hypothetical protein
VTAIECARESDVLDALTSARWPHRVNRELVEHVEACAICADVVAVVAAMRDDHDVAWQQANIPSSGQVWWRAEMHARQEAIREASRPIAIAQGVAALLALGLAATASWFAWPSIHGRVSSFISQTATLGSPLTLPLMVALAVLLVIAPLAVYLVLSDE